MATRVALVRVLVAGVLLAATVGPLIGQDNAPVRNRPLMALIDSFLQHPFNEDLRVGLFDSANARPDVTVNITGSVTPFLCYADTASIVRALDALLLTAFVAGDMREQLRMGRDTDQPEAGIRAVLNVYQIIQSRVPNYRVPEVDQWREAQASSRLSAVADSLGAHSGDCKPKAARYPPGAALGTPRP